MAGEPTLTYDELLTQLAVTQPRVAKALTAAHDNRRRNLAAYASGARLAGLNELLIHLDLVRQSLADHGLDYKVGFLLNRAAADFETAVEAALAGYVGVAHDAMRDIMEIEFLLRDFAAAPDYLDRWLTSSDAERRTFFSANQLRQRHAGRLGVTVEKLPEHTDYKGHSVVLHVTPARTPFHAKGLSSSEVPFGVDMAFWDIFQHAHRLLFTIHDLLLTEQFAAVENPDPHDMLPLVRSGFERTQEMQAIFLALLNAAQAAGDA